MLISQRTEKSPSPRKKQQVNTPKAPALCEREERAPHTGTTTCSRQDSPQVLMKQLKTHLVSSSLLASLERLEL